GCGKSDASTTGLVAYVSDEPAGWVAVEPRTAYPKLRTSRIPWSARSEDKDDETVWAVTCFAVRKGYRGRGLMYPLAAATVEYAREHGARALEAYPMITEPGKEITWGEVHVGARQACEDAGFEQITHPTNRRVVMRVALARRSGARLSRTALRSTTDRSRMPTAMRSRRHRRSAAGRVAARNARPTSARRPATAPPTPVRAAGRPRGDGTEPAR